jgi:hypothetical protein
MKTDWTEKQITQEFNITPGNFYTLNRDLMVWVAYSVCLLIPFGVGSIVFPEHEGRVLITGVIFSSIGLAVTFCAYFILRNKIKQRIKENK